MPIIRNIFVGLESITSAIRAFIPNVLSPPIPRLPTTYRLPNNSSQGPRSVILFPKNITSYCVPFSFWYNSSRERSEERRVGKECRSRWATCHYKTKEYESNR